MLMRRPPGAVALSLALPKTPKKSSSVGRPSTVASLRRPVRLDYWEGMTETRPAADTPVQELLSLLDLEPIEVNIFRGISPRDRSQRVFGGQVLGQALVAATRTVEDRICHSLHAYFLLPGDPKVPILYEVDRSRDGKSFSSRRVVAIQHGRPIFHMSVSFQIDEPGLEHQIDAPQVPRPESLPSEDETRLAMAEKVPAEHRDHFLRPRPIELRPVEPGDILRPQKRPPHQAFWVRATGRAPERSRLAAMRSGLCLGHDTARYLPVAARRSAGSTSACRWPASITRCGFIAPSGPTNGCSMCRTVRRHRAARGFNRGLIYAQDGTLVASVAQEGLVRFRDE